MEAGMIRSFLSLVQSWWEEEWIHKAWPTVGSFLDFDSWVRGKGQAAVVCRPEHSPGTALPKEQLPGHWPTCGPCPISQAHFLLLMHSGRLHDLADNFFFVQEGQGQFLLFAIKNPNHTIWPVNSTFRHISKKNDNIYPCKNLYTSVLSSIHHDSQRRKWLKGPLTNKGVTEM